MKAFEIGKTYIAKSPCDHNCTWTFTVAKRTTCTVTITDGEKTKRCRIIKGLSEENGAEAIFPLGQYSMAPILRADSVVEEVKEENEETAETDNVIALKKRLSWSPWPSSLLEVVGCSRQWMKEEKPAWK